MDENPLCFSCGKRVVPLDNGNCPGCGAGLVAPKPGSEAGPSSSTPTLRRPREGLGRHGFRIVLGGLFLAYAAFIYLNAPHDPYEARHVPVGSIIVGIVLVLWGFNGWFNDD